MKKLLVGASSLAILASAQPATAGTDNYIGEMYAFGGNFCPRDSASAEGQLLSIAQNTALFSILGTTYGGNGQTTFALPDMRGRSAVGQGQGPGLSFISQGETAGVENTTLLITNMPMHTHDARVRASNQLPNTNDPSGNTFATFAPGTNMYTTGNDNVTMGNDEVQVAAAGGSQPFSIRNPYLGMRWCVVLNGIFPPRN